MRIAYTGPIAAAALLLISGVGVPASPQGAASAPPPNPYLLKGSSAHGIATAKCAGGSRGWSILGHTSRSSSPDTLHIIAFRVEFNKGVGDTSELTTGNGLFGIFGGTGAVSKGDLREKGYYAADSIYRYDNVPHNRGYFSSQLEFAARYFHRVSRGRLVLTYDIYPNADQAAYCVDSAMTQYSPAAKKPKETWDEYYYRKTRGLMSFVRQAVKAAAAGKGSGNRTYEQPFAGLRYGADSVLVDSGGRRVGLLLIHAGASYLTDGGAQGSFGQNSPSDMIDAFIYGEFFKYFRDTIGFDTAGGRTGIAVRNGANQDLLLDEVMMLPETSNQDKLNWGIHGILVNQIARQLGIPDLFSTSSGISGIGAFCIMDFAGYSAAQGFVPPWPSAWVRAFMGWDEPRVVSIGAPGSYRVKALCASDSTGADTTILLVPINDHEYYLIENRQRNLGGPQTVFNYDTSAGDDKTVYIRPYPYNARIDTNVTRTDTGAYRTILDVRNYDVGIPASGLLVWHVDEEIIRNRLQHNMVNADSTYRGIALVEADGVNDLGILFQDVFYQAAFDWGGAEDLFPHTTRKLDGATITVDSIGPRTRPSTRSNDGGQTWLTLKIGSSATARTEVSAIRDYYVHSLSDTFFTVTVRWDFLSPGWPKQIVPEPVFEPLIWDQPAPAAQRVVLLSRSGRLYAWRADTGQSMSLGSRTARYLVRDLRGAVVSDSNGAPRTDTCVFLDSVAGAITFPTQVGSRVFFPAVDSGRGVLRVLRAITAGGEAVWEAPIALPAPPSTYVCNFTADRWAVGCSNGVVAFGDSSDTIGSLRLATSSPLTAIAALPGSPDSVACIQADGRLSICSSGSTSVPASVAVKGGIGPYSLVTGNLDNDPSGRSEVVVCDSRHGLWTYTIGLAPSPGWSAAPNDLANTFYAGTEPVTDSAGRARLPANCAAPSLADINGDGRLDILIGGTNGVYAFNYKGVYIAGWPYYLDNRYWYQRGVVASTPVAGTGADGRAQVLFASPTGDNATFAITRIDSTDKANTKIYFRRSDGSADSIWGVTKGQVDSVLVFNDSLIAPYVLPGGYIDAVSPDAKRPRAATIVHPTVGADPVYYWPMTIGAPTASSPILADLGDDGKADLLAVSTAGWVYRWQLNDSLCKGSPIPWAQAGFNGSRPFAYMAAPPAATAARVDPVRLYNYPNPTNGSRIAVFRYAFSGPARDVRLDIFSYTGYRVFSWTEPAERAATNYPDWNEVTVNLDKIGPAVYRCRMEATIGGRKETKYWKMAVVK